MDKQVYQGNIDVCYPNQTLKVDVSIDKVNTDLLNKNMGVFAHLTGAARVYS